MTPAELLATLRASGCTEPVALVRDGVVLLAGEAPIVIAALRALGDPMADQIEAYRQHARGIVLSLDSETREVRVDGVPRDLTLTAAGGVS